MRRFLLSLGLLALVPSAHASLPAAIDGSWYSPLQSGHGLTIERIDADHALLFWHVFDPDGKPLTLYIETAINGDRLEGEAFAPGGMRFGSFDMTEFVLPSWGRVSMQFHDCQRATLRYDSPQAGYGSGEIEVVRLLPVREAHCSLDRPAGLSALAGQTVGGRLAPHYDDDAEGSRRWEVDVQGVIDRRGALWLGDAEYNDGAFADSFVVKAVPQAALPGEAKFAARGYANGWLNSQFDVTYQGSYPAARQGGFDIALSTRNGRAGGVLLDTAAHGWDGWLRAPHTTFVDERIVPTYTINLADDRYRPDSYTFSVSNPMATDGTETWRLGISDDLRLCVRRADVSACRFEGVVTYHDSEHFEFVLQEVGSTAPAFRGVGKATFYNLANVILRARFDRIHLFGHNGETGLLLIGDNTCQGAEC